MAILFQIICLSLIVVVCNSATIPKVKLSDGNYMPVVGFGTFLMPAEQVDASVTSALENGYRHIDTASLYDNEKAIGNTLKKWFAKGGKREDVFIATKLSMAAMRPSEVADNLDQSLKYLGLDYLDMYMIHLPFGIYATPEFDTMNPKEGTFSVDYSTDHIAIWKELEKQVKAGKIRSIGLSNFNSTQVQRVWDNAEIKPSNLQIENNAYIQQKELVDLCKKLDIVVTAYSPLASGGLVHLRRKRETVELPPLIRHPIVAKIADKYGKTPAQVVLRHGLQRNLVIIPKSTNPKRINENIDLFDFELTEEDMNELSGLDQHGKYRKFDFLSFTGVENHPEYPFSDKIPK